MAGIDDIGGQVFPQGEWDGPWGLLGEHRCGLFYHYVLGKLGSSLAAIDPLKKGRCMCEIFGNYGWEEGVRLEKYLVDHFLVRGVNYFVPHAFSPKAYPDPDCPPHFYAHGNNPQYRHFGALMAYLERVCRLFNEGKSLSPVAVLYTAESEWAGPCMPLETVAMPLMDNQVDFTILPADCFSQPERFHTRLGQGLEVNGRRFKALIVPACDYLPSPVAQRLTELEACQCAVLFVGKRPQGVCGEPCPGEWESFPIVEPESLPVQLAQYGCRLIQLDPPSNRVRCMGYQEKAPRYLLVNEGETAYHGVITVSSQGPCCAYDAWDDHRWKIPWRPVPQGTEVEVTMEPRKSLILLFDHMEEEPPCPPSWEGTPIPWGQGWIRSLCKSLEYPQFHGAKLVDLPDSLEREMPFFSGFVRYEKCYCRRNSPERLLLEITDAYEGVEVFVNGKSAGIQIVPPFRFDLSQLLQPGENQIRIEVATTLERENADSPDPLREYLGVAAKTPHCPSGINGEVFLYFG